tara:strand:+ start:419 stop:625 length:207 start_codon:yes stop_codon:yes gene_type:complete
VKETFKVKIAHILDNCDTIELVCFVEGDSYNDALNTAKMRFSEVVKQLADETDIEIDKTKIETGAHKH